MGGVPDPGAGALTGRRLAVADPYVPWGAPLPHSTSEGYVFAVASIVDSAGLMWIVAAQAILTSPSSKSLWFWCGVADPHACSTTPRLRIANAHTNTYAIMGVALAMGADSKMWLVSADYSGNIKLW